MNEAKPGTELVAVKTEVKKSLEMAAALNLVKAPKVKAMSALLQAKVDPDDPDYKYHSQGIIDVMTDVLKDFNNEKKDVDTEWEKTETAENNLITDTEGQMTENLNTIDTLKGDVEGLGSEIAEAREDLVAAEGLLKDDQLYLKDLTSRCEQRAKAYDQRSSMRAQEIQALSEALTILQDKVKDKEGERAFVQKPLLKVTGKVTQVKSFLQTSLQT